MSAHIAQYAQRPRLAFGLLNEHALGLAAGLAAATIWGGALAMTRLGVAAEAAALGPHDIVLLRFLAPALLLLPVARRAVRRLRGADLPRLALLLAGGGAPFVLLAGAGLREAAAADAGTLLPGTMPLWVAAASLLTGGAGATMPAPMQRLGLCLMACSVLLVAGPPAMGAEGLAGPAMLVGASWLAAGYTLALRRSGLGALEATALVSLGSVLGFLPYYLLACDSGLAAAGWGEIAAQAAWQGGLSGLVAPLAFALAVARLGAARAAAIGALSPASAALFGFVLLGEVPAPHVLAGLASAVLGVALAAGAPRPATPRAG